MTGDGSNVMASVNDIFNPSLYLKQPQGEGHFWDKEDFQAAMARMSPPSLEVNVPAARMRRPLYCMLARDGSCRPTAVSLATEDSTHSLAENKFYDYLE
jgi:hypothetical protein